MSLVKSCHSNRHLLAVSIAFLLILKSVKNSANCPHLHRRDFTTSAKINAEDLLLRRYLKPASNFDEEAAKYISVVLVPPARVDESARDASAVTVTADGTSKNEPESEQKEATAKDARFQANILTTNTSTEDEAGIDEDNVKMLKEKYAHFFSESSPCGNTNHQPSESQAVNPIFLLAANLYTAMIFVCGIIGNTLVLFTVLCYSKMHTVTNIFLFCLAVSDLCFTLAIPMLLMTALLNRWIFGNILCKIFYSLTTLSQFTSSFFLMILALDRYVATCLPFTLGTRRTASKAVIICIITWCIAIVMIVPVYVCSVSRPSIARVDSFTCTIDFSWPFKHLTNNIGYVFYCFVVGFALPATCTIFCYASVLVRLRGISNQIKFSNALNDNSNSNNQSQLSNNNRRKKRQNKITKLVLAIITAYLVCSTPYWIGQISLTIKVLFEHGQWSETLAVVEKDTLPPTAFDVVKNITVNVWPMSSSFAKTSTSSTTSASSLPAIIEHMREMLHSSGSFSNQEQKREEDYDFIAGETDSKLSARSADTGDDDTVFTQHDCSDNSDQRQPQEFNMVYIFYTMQCIMYTNSATNPIIVFLLNESFHRGFLRLLYSFCSKISSRSGFVQHGRLFRRLCEKSGAAHVVTEAGARSASNVDVNNNRNGGVD